MSYINWHILLVLINQFGWLIDTKSAITGYGILRKQKRYLVISKVPCLADVKQHTGFDRLMEMTGQTEPILPIVQRKWLLPLSERLEKAKLNVERRYAKYVKNQIQRMPNTGT